MRTAAAVALALAAPGAYADAQGISMSGSAPTLRVSSAVPGESPLAVSGQTSTVSVTSGTLPRSILVSVSVALPPGVALEVAIQAPSGATSAGFVTLTTTPQAAVSGIPANVTTPALRITYRLSPAAAGGVVPVGTSRSVRFAVQ